MLGVHSCQNISQAGRQGIAVGTCLRLLKPSHQVPGTALGLIDFTFIEGLRCLALLQALRHFEALAVGRIKRQRQSEDLRRPARLDRILGVRRSSQHHQLLRECHHRIHVDRQFVALKWHWPFGRRHESSLCQRAHRNHQNQDQLHRVHAYSRYARQQAVIASHLLHR